jgi:hypothetical protein
MAAAAKSRAHHLHSATIPALPSREMSDDDSCVCTDARYVRKNMHVPSLARALLASSLLVGCSSGGDAAAQANGEAGGQPESGSDVDVADDTDAPASDAAADSTATDGAAEGGGVATDTETVRRRLKALDGVMRKLSSIGVTTTSPADRLAKLASEALTVTDVASCTIDKDGLDARLTLWNGENISISLGMNPGAGPFTTPPPPPPLPLEYGLAPTKKALILQMKGLSEPGFAAIAAIESYLTKAGFDKPTVGAPDLSFLRSSVHGYAVVYINTHGEDGQLFTEQPVTDGKGVPMEWPIDINAVKPYDFGADLMAASERDATIAAERAVGQLDIMVSPYYNEGEDALKYAARYSITPSFIAKNWTLEKHALVHLDACHTAESTKLFDAVKTAGADAFIGWVHPAPYPECYRASQRFFDDVLGTNMYSTLMEPQRPFDVDAVMDYLTASDVATVRTTDDKKMIHSATMTKFSAAPVILVPSIEHIEVAPIASSFAVYGEFGSTPGKITVGGVETTCGTWTSTKLDHCALPKIGAPGAYGPVVVDHDGRKSNPVPITHWSGTLSYQETASGLDEKIDVAFQLRADVHRFRTKPRETPHDAKSAMTLFTEGDGATQCKWSYTLGSSCSGSGTVSFMPGSTPFCAVEVKFDDSLPEAKRFALQPIMAGVTMSCGAGMTTVPDFYSDPYLPDESTLTGSTTGNWFWVGLDPVTYAFEARDDSKNLGTATFDIKWPAIPADSIPQTTDPR